MKILSKPEGFNMNSRRCNLWNKKLTSTEPEGFNIIPITGILKNKTMEKQEFTITLYTENSVGLIGRISGIFSRRKINIESLNTSPSEVEGIHRFTILINETEEVVRKLCRQLEKQMSGRNRHFTKSLQMW